MLHFIRLDVSRACLHVSALSASQWRCHKNKMSVTKNKQRPLRGASLVEMMVVVAILAILAAMAAPGFLPTIKKARLDGEAGGLAGFLEGVRQRAISDGRCYRVRIAGFAATGKSIVAEQRVSGDCVNLTKDGGSATGWTQKVSLIGEPGTTFAMALTDLTYNPTVAPDSEGGPELVFRPNGWLRGNDDNNPNDRGRFVVKQNQLPGTVETVNVGPTGRICVVIHGAAPPAISPATSLTDCNLAIP